VAVTYGVSIKWQGNFVAVPGTVFSSGLTLTGDTEDGGVLGFYRAGGAVLQGVKTISGGLKITDMNFRIENVEQISNSGQAISIAAKDGGSKGFIKNCQQISSESKEAIVCAGNSQKLDMHVKVKLVNCKASSQQDVAFLFFDCWGEADQLVVENCGIPPGSVGKVGVSISKSTLQMSHIDTTKGYFTASESLLNLKEVLNGGFTLDRSVVSSWGIQTQQGKPLNVNNTTHLNIKQSQLKGPTQIQNQCFVKMWNTSQTSMPTNLQGVLVASYSSLGGYSVSGGVVVPGGYTPITLTGILHSYNCTGKFTIPGLPSTSGDTVRSFEDYVKEIENSPVEKSIDIVEDGKAFLSGNGTFGLEKFPDVIGRDTPRASSGSPLFGGVDVISNPTINHQTGGLFIVKSLKSLLMRTYDSGLFQSSKDINVAARKNNIIIAGGSNYAVSSRNLASPPWQRGATSQSVVMS
jgi:hypothetical protein